MQPSDVRPLMADGGRGWCDILAPVAIAIHHSAARFFPRAAPTPADEIAHLRMIDVYHVSLGYGAFGYHVAVFPSTRAYWCGTLTRCRAHVKDRNHELIGVVAIGDYTLAPPSPSHIAATAHAVSWIRDNVGRMLPTAPHKQLAIAASPTACPGVWPWPAAQEDDMDPLLEQKLKAVFLTPFTITRPDGKTATFPSQFDFVRDHTQAFDVNRIVWLAGKA